MNENIKDLCLNYINELKNLEKNHFDVHKDNLIKKLQNTFRQEKSAVFKNCLDVKNFIHPYLIYRKNLDVLLNQITDENKDDVHDKMILELQKYKDKTNTINSGTNQYFTSQSKYEPTILEEFIGFLLFPIIKDCPNIKCGPVKAYSEMNINVSIKEKQAITSFEQKTKNQDFSIYTEKKLDGSTIVLQIPLISIECKTYIDKTMLEGSINTAERIKRGNPHSKFYVVSETWDLSDQENINPNEIDDMFIVRKCKRKENGKIDADVLKDLYNTIQQDLTNLALKTTPLEQIRKTGKIKR